ncbi:MAG: acyl-CoA dehydrogenase family protein [Candidatus Neomarinimicrobiota bacterium]|tara:strand:- start:236 stop:1408 length:1173 start_codon:yes stop_codon:yes gene_type:complete
MKNYLDKINEVVEQDIIPLENDFLLHGFLSVLPKLNKCRQKVKKLGLWTPYLSTEYGGLGLSLLEFASVSEILGKSLLGHYCFNSQAPDIGNIELLKDHASEELRNKFLSPLILGEIRSCFGMTEPQNPGSNPIWMDTVAIKDGNDYVINGNKWFTSSADGASICVVMAVTDPNAENKYSRASMFVVPTDNPGFELVRNIPVMGDEGEDYNSHAETKFTDCRIPATYMIGDIGQGFMLAQERLGPGRIHHCMRWIGICERALDLMCKRVSSRELNPNQFLSEKQTVQNWIAESATEIYGARLMVMDCAKKVQELQTKGARKEISMIKLRVADVLMKILDRAIQAHGALGITDYTPLAYWYRHERGARIYDGADEVHKNLIARTILKKYIG